MGQIANQHVLKKVELFVARTRPEIVAMHDERLLLFVAGFIDDRDAALFSEGRIGEDHLVFAVFTGKRVLLHQLHQLVVAVDNVVFHLIRGDLCEKLPGAFDLGFFDLSKVH
jgi:hypothetical protein